MENNELKFYWIPFDSQITDPIKSSKLNKLNINELENFSKSLKEPMSGLRAKDVEKEGFFMAHKKLGARGFTRYITKTLSPLTFDSVEFDSEFKKIGDDIENGQLKEEDFGIYTWARTIFERFDETDNDDE